MPNGMKIFSGSSSKLLTSDICVQLGIEPGKISRKQFADGELHIQFEENIRGCDVFLVQSTDAPANDNIMELLLMANAAKLASAKRINSVIPYFGYGRQERKDRPRVPISAKVVADLIQTQKIKRVLTMDLHAASIQGFFDIPVDHLYAAPIFVEDILKNPDLLEKLTIVSPDVGGVARARIISQKLNVPLAVIDKHRKEANISEVMNVIGDVKGRNCILLDDMIDTAGTLIKGSEALLKAGARSVDAYATHGIFSNTTKSNALENIANSTLQRVKVTDTIWQELNVANSYNKVSCLSVAPLFAKAIKAIYSNESISSLFS